MRLLITLFLLSITNAFFAQNATLTGVVTDANTNESLPGVSILSGKNGTVTKEDGKFELKLPAGKTVVTFSYVGYNTQSKTITLSAGEQFSLNIALEDGTNLLQTATVTSGKFEKPLGEVTVSLDVLKPGLIKSTNATAVDQVLTKVPGVTILDGQAQIRGGSGFSYGAGTRVLLLVDDMPALQPDAGFPNWSDFPVENIAQIEVLKGAASALYGSSAMNGIVNIRTGYAKNEPETEAAIWGKLWGAPKDPNKKWWGDTSELNQPYETGFNFVHRRKMGKMDFVLGGFGLTRKSYNRATSADYARLTPNFRFRVSDKLTLSLNSNFNLGQSTSFFVWKNDSIGAYQPGLNSAVNSKGRLRFNIDPSLQYVDNHGNKHKILSRYYYIHNNNNNNQSNDSRNYYAEYQFQRNFEPFGLVMTTGAVGQISTVSAPLYGDYNFKSKNIAGYLQLDYKPIEALNLSAGVRYEGNEQNSPELIKVYENDFDTIPGGVVKESKPVFRFGANLKLAQATYLRASWGQGYRYPTLAEKFINTDFSQGNTIVPNPKLVSESGWTAEIGLKQGFQVSTWKGYADLTFFRSEYQNMMEFVLANLVIGLDPGPPPTLKPLAFFQSQNVGDTRVSGVEGSIVGTGKLGNGTLSMLVGYTYIDPKYIVFDQKTKQSASDTSNVLKYRFKHLFKWDSEYEWNGISLGISAQYFSRMQSIDKIFQVDIVEPFKGVKNFRDNHGAFTLWDARIAYKITPHHKVAFLCNNITNTEYAFRPALLEAPRNYTLRVESKF